MRLLVALLALFFLLASCRKETTPSAPPFLLHILYQDTPVLHYPVSLHFYTDLDDMESYHWDFGNGTTADAASATAAYYQSGRFQVTLTVTKNGSKKIYTQMADVPFLDRSVAIMYVITRDQAYDDSLMRRIQQVIPIIQAWYREQTGGTTFHINNPAVDTIHSAYAAFSFSSRADAFDRIKAELNGRLRRRLDPETHDLLAFLPGTLRGDTSGLGSVDAKGQRMALVLGTGCNDLLNEPDISTGFGTYITAHELGHSFGLKHNNDLEALMWGPETGPPYIHTDRAGFPNCYLLGVEKSAVHSGGFFFED